MMISFYAGRCKEVGGFSKFLSRYASYEAISDVYQKVSEMELLIKDEYEKALKERVVGMAYSDDAYLLAFPIIEDKEHGVMIWAVEDEFAVTVMRDQLYVVEIKTNVIADVRSRMMAMVIDGSAPFEMESDYD